MNTATATYVGADIDAQTWQRASAALAAKARSAGQPLGVNDAYIAATAQAHGLAVASRDERAFQAAGVEVINPWK